MTHEVIIAADKVKAETYAMERGWRQVASIYTMGVERGEYIRLDNVGPTRLEDDTVVDRWREVRVKFVGNPMALDQFPSGTPVHVASFPGGIPAVWAKALSRHSVITDISDKRIGGYKPMCSAPQDRDILIFDAATMRWHEATFQRGQWYSATGNAYVIEEAVCWVDRPENPPEIMIRRAKQSTSSPVVISE